MAAVLGPQGRGEARIFAAVALALMVLWAAYALAAKPVTHHLADAPMRTSEVLASRVPAYADAAQTLGTDGVVALLNVVSGVGSTTDFAPPPYPNRLQVRAFDTGADSSALTCAACTIAGYNSLGISVSEVVEAVDESTERLTRNSFEAVAAFSCSGCENFVGLDTVKLDTSDHIAVDVPIGGARDVLAVCFTELDDAATDWICTSGSTCTVDSASQSVDIATCGDGSPPWTATDNMTIRIRARAAPGIVNTYAR